MIPQQILTTEMTHIVVDKSTDNNANPNYHNINDKENREVKHDVNGRRQTAKMGC